MVAAAAMVTPIVITGFSATVRRPVLRGIAKLGHPPIAMTRFPVPWIPATKSLIPVSMHPTMAIATITICAQTTTATLQKVAYIRSSTSHVLPALRVNVTGNVARVKRVLTVQTVHRAPVQARPRRRPVVLGTLSVRLTQIVAVGLLARRTAAAGSQKKVEMKGRGMSWEASPFLMIL